jgi:hypothetical protein
VRTLTEPIPPLRKNLKVKLREDAVIVEGLKETKVTSLAEAMTILEKGRENRTTNDNSINSSSSRSHTVFIVRVDQAKLHIVDLAGSERGKRTQATGARQVEASNINLSLSQLMQCLDAMRANQKLARMYPDKPRDKPPFRPIPFRDCKLTMLFRDCLRGKNCGGVCMIVNASPDPVDFEETSQALRYGELTRSTSIENNPAATNLLSLAAAVLNGGAKYDYNGRLVRTTAIMTASLQPIVNEHPISSNSNEVQTIIQNLSRNKGENAVKFAVREVEEERMISVDGPRDMRRLSSPIAIPSISAGISREFASPVELNILPKAATPVDPLVEENEQLRKELAEARAKCVTIEMEIRDELSLEMAERLKEMEQRYLSRLNRAQHLGDERTEMLQMSMKKAQQEHLTVEGYTADDIKLLLDQIKECEEEMQRMRDKHKRDMEALQTELNNARRANIEVKSQQMLQNVKQPQNTPSAVAEMRKRIDRLLKELEDEKEAHRQVILERAELQDSVERAGIEQRLFNDREETLMRELRSLKDQVSQSRETIIIQEKQLQLWKTRVGSPQQAAAQLSGVAPNMLLSKKKSQYNKENNDGHVLRSKENYENERFHVFA